MIQYQESIYEPWGRVLSITDGTVELKVTLDFGPRIIYFAPVGGKNIMHEDVDEQTTLYNDYFREKGLEEPWRIYGGHRLWKSPEEWMTYYPDCEEVNYEVAEDHFTFTSEQEITSGLIKTLGIFMQGEGKVLLRHEFFYNGDSVFEGAMWGLTVLKAGGRVYCPLNKRHEGFHPVRNYTLWCGAHLDDPRFSHDDRHFCLRHSADESLHPFKIGSFVAKGEVYYVLDDVMLVKRFSADPTAVYPDGRCNFETYTNHLFIEVESLSPMGKLLPGERMVHYEEWQLLPYDEADLAERLSVQV